MGVAAAREVKSGVPAADGDDAQVRLPAVADLAAGGGARRAAQRGHRRRAERGRGHRAREDGRQQKKHRSDERGGIGNERRSIRSAVLQKNSGVRVTYSLDESIL